jgi:hypothetical protein
MRVFGLPISVQGTPGKDLSISVATPRGSGVVLPNALPVAAIHAPPVRAGTPAQTAAGTLEDWLRGAITFTIVGWLLLLIAPGLRGRGRAATRSLPFGRLGLGIVLAIDIPLVALLILIFGVPIGLWWVGLITLAVFVALLIAAYAFSGYQLGMLLLDRFGYETRFAWLLAVPLGVALLALGGLLPYVGAIISLLAVFYGLGSMLYAPTARREAVTAEEPATRAAEVGAPAGKPLVE